MVKRDDNKAQDSVGNLVRSADDCKYIYEHVEGWGERQSQRIRYKKKTIK